MCISLAPVCTASPLSSREHVQTGAGRTITPILRGEIQPPGTHRWEICLAHGYSLLDMLLDGSVGSSSEYLSEQRSLWCLSIYFEAKRKGAFLHCPRKASRCLGRTLSNSIDSHVRAGQCLQMLWAEQALLDQTRLELDRTSPGHLKATVCRPL